LPTYLNVRRGLVSWLTTTDHKRIGIMYLCGILFFFLFGAAMAVTFRLKLYSPGLHFISNETYNRLLTLHGVALFDPSRGGDPVLFQHLFWTYSHPAVYIMILPAMGVASEIIPTFSRKTIFGYKYIAFSSVAIASIGSLVWGHHMFTAGMSEFARVIFSFLTFLVVTLFNGKRVKDQNPWGGATLEWQIPSPPPSSNFVTPPDLSRGPYEYPVEVQDP